jgi:hypothetical protein
MLNINNMNINSQTQLIDDDKKVISPRRNRKQRSSPLTVFQNWRLLLELLLCIGIGILIFFYVGGEQRTTFSVLSCPTGQ